MKKFVYLAGPISGCKVEEAIDWRKKVQEALPKNIIGISPLRNEPTDGEVYALESKDPRFSTPLAISGKNYYDTMAADIVLAYFPKLTSTDRLSIGTIIEIGWAIGAKKPIILVTEDENITKHPLIKANINWIVKNLDIAVDVISGLFKEYTD